jgi:hypothetical protein
MPLPATTATSYPQVTKRAGSNRYPRKTLRHKNIYHSNPPEIELHRHVS